MDWRPIAAIGAFIFTGAVILGMFLALYAPPSPSSYFRPTVIETGQAQGECTSGETAPCKEDGCEGTKTCLHGSWSSCVLPNQCEEGERQFCPLPGCSNGVQVCSSCSEWGPCLPQ